MNRLDGIKLVRRLFPGKASIGHRSNSAKRPTEEVRRNQCVPIKANWRAKYWRLFPGKVQAGTRHLMFHGSISRYLQSFIVMVGIGPHIS
jgi:hypothetical protein